MGGMIRYEDLLAARILDRHQPELRTEVEDALRRLESYRGREPVSLLTALVNSGSLPRDAAWAIHGKTMKHNRDRALGLYLQLLRNAGVKGELVRSGLAKLGDTDAVGLGELLVRHGCLGGETDRNLRYRARVALDRFQAERLREYRASTLKGAHQTSMLPAVRFTDVSASVEENPAEAEAILSRTLHDADETIHAPQFAVPDWIDMGDELTGKVLCGYRFLGKIGSGAMGSVFLADRRDSENPIAFKLLNKDAPKEAKDRFKREVFIQGLLPEHESIIALYDAGKTESGYHYLAMEFVDGTDLEQILAIEGKLEPARALEIIAQIADALEAIHGGGIIHRDIKPANILATSSGNRAKLADFGIAVNQDLGGLSEYVFKSLEGTVTGTAEFVSPEQASAQPLDGRSDLYSLGVVLYQMLSGQLPFDCENATGFLTSHMFDDPTPLHELEPDLPPQLYALLDKALQKEPDDRQQSGSELAKALRKVASKLTVTKNSDKPSPKSLWNLFKG